jgi:hypothetical protein
MSENNENQEGAGSAPPIDPAQLEYLRQRLESEQNLPLGVLAGAVASLVGAALWAGITVATGYQIGFMAIGVGFLVGFAVRVAGKGISAPFGVLGAALALVGCLVGNLLAVSAIVAQSEGVPFWSVVAQLDPELIQRLMVAFFSPMDLLFYAIAVYEGYRLAFRQIKAQEWERMLSGGASA